MHLNSSILLNMYLVPLCQCIDGLYILKNDSNIISCIIIIIYTCSIIIYYNEMALSFVYEPPKERMRRLASAARVYLL